MAAVGKQLSFCPESSERLLLANTRRLRINEPARETSWSVPPNFANFVPVPGGRFQYVAAMNRSLIISASLLFCANVAALVCAIWFHWNLFEIVLLYWIQAFIVGVFQRQKVEDMVRYARHPSRAEWFRAHGTSLMQVGLHNGFAGIYGVFWAGVGVILLITFFKSGRIAVDLATILFASSAFILAHWWSYRGNKATDEQRIIDIDVLILPMARMLLPLHVFCLVVDLEITTTPTTTATWMAIKTAADLGAHIAEHNRSRTIPST